MSDYYEDMEMEYEQGHQEPEWDGGECPFCGEMSWYFGGEFAECVECGKTHKDLEDK